MKSQQAGETVSCDCGIRLTIPDLRNLRELPKASTDDYQHEQSWTPMRGTFFGIGFGTCLLSAGLFGLFAFKNSQLDSTPPDLDLVKQFQVDLSEITPIRAWILWNDVQNRSLYRDGTPLYLKNRARSAWLHKLMFATGIVAIVGLFVAGASTVWGRTTRRQ